MDIINRTAKQKILALAAAAFMAVAVLSYNNDIAAAVETGIGGQDAAAVQVSCLETDGTDIYAGALADGIYKSDDHGANWTAANNGIASASIRGVYHDGGALYVYTNDGIYKSVDSAESWTSVNNGLLSKIVSAMISNGDTLFAATTEGIYKSADGETWYFSNSGLEGRITTAFAFDGTTIFAGTENNGIYKSVDGGANWHNINNGIARELSVLSMECFGGDLYVGTHLGIYKTGDGGINWDVLNSDWANPKASALYYDGFALYAGTLDGEIYKSDNNGKTWSMAGVISGSFGIRVFLSGGSALYAGTDGGVYKSSDDGTSWVAAGVGIVKGETKQQEIDGIAKISPYTSGRIGRIIGLILLTIVILGLGGAALYLLWKEYKKYKSEQL